MGYGAGGMLGGMENPKEVNGVAVPEFDRYRKLLISLDIDLTKIPVKSHFGKMVFKMLNFVKIPFTALEISPANGGMKLHPLYF